jgi:hypothetical protein
MSIDEIQVMIGEITLELETPPKGMNELRRKDQWVVFNGRLEMANIKNQLLIEIGGEPISYNDVELAKVVGVTPENVRHMVRHSYRSFQNKVGHKCRREIVEGLREADSKRKSQSDENQGGLPNPFWNEADARARMGGEN